ncbi:MAG: PQQ-binding-like beta-propeller repeat protein, partial [Verrucomicrobia bacterium]|nr:PQQ-binding-like beta-propeller repeat protein [Verrucomicrobiota bacterium]
MAPSFAPQASPARAGASLILILLGQVLASATDWPQYRGPATDGSSPDAIATSWATNSAGFVVWANASLTNGFSSFAVSQGRAFTLISKDDGTGNLLEYCVAADAATGTNLWATPIDSAPWDPSVNYYGGDGIPPYNTGDGPRTTPSATDGRVFALSGQMKLACLNATNGSVIWSSDLVSAYGASTIPWENAASPCLDHDLLFVNLNSSTNNQNLVAFRTADGSQAWSSQNENVTHATPIVATIQGVRQVIFAT